MAPTRERRLPALRAAGKSAKSSGRPLRARRADREIPLRAAAADFRAASAKIGGFMRRWITDETLTTVERLDPVARRAGMTLPQLALAWVLRRPEVASAITGATKPEQLIENAAASGKPLSEEVLRDIDAALGGKPKT